jgi:hypothetical protein
MPTESPFFFAIAGLSMSLAGLAGLVAGLRSGQGMRPIDRYRLREIVEFAFANAVLSVAYVAVAPSLGSTISIHAAGIVGLLYVVVDAAILYRRRAGLGLSRTETRVPIVAIVRTIVIVLAAVTSITGQILALEVFLIVLLARPMIAFLFVLNGLEERAP